MKFNSRKFWRVFALLSLIESLILLTACTSAWITAVSALLPSIGAVANAVVAFIAALQGKTVSADVYAAIQKWQQNVAAEIANAETIIATAKQQATAGVLAQLQAVMQAVSQEFTSILNNVNVTDSATIAKLTQFLTLGIAAVNSVLALIPLATAKLESGASEAELAHYDKLAASSTVNAEKTLKETYAAIVAEKTANEDVNAALDSMPKSI